MKKPIRTQRQLERMIENLGDSLNEYRSLLMDLDRIYKNEQKYKEITSCYEEDIQTLSDEFLAMCMDNSPEQQASLAENVIKLRKRNTRLS